jgi:hypothetical protein
LNQVHDFARCLVFDFVDVEKSKHALPI